MAGLSDLGLHTPRYRPEGSRSTCIRGAVAFVLCASSRLQPFWLVSTDGADQIEVDMRFELRIRLGSVFGQYQPPPEPSKPFNVHDAGWCSP